MDFPLTDEQIDKIIYLRNNVSARSRYEQMAEEACELAHAALKFVRTWNTDNPTPVDPHEALRNLLEEVDDLYLCLVVNALLSCEVEPIERKLNRWYERVKKAQDEAGE